jgi:hypothetical protein
MNTVIASMAKVRESVQSNLPKENQKPQSIRLGKQNDLGDWGPQGDVNIRLVGKNGQMTPDFAKWKPSESDKLPNWKGQVAEGETRGSRHQIEFVERVQGYRNTVNADTISAGPIVAVNQDVDLIHPDHGTFHLEGGCVYEFTFQSTADTEQARVRSRD